MNLSDDRIKELREWVLYNKGWSNKRNDLLAILSDYSSMRAESERLREDFEYKNEQLGSALIRVEKAEAELAAADKELAVRTESQGVAMAEVERLREDCDRTADVVVEQMAQLAKQSPLVEAVMGADICEGPVYSMATGRLKEKSETSFSDDGKWSILHAALALREGKK